MLTLQLLILLLQFHKQATIERLATVFAQPIRFESRRSLQRFLSLPQLSIRLLWFPLLKRWVKTRHLNELEPLLAFFASFVLAIPFVQQIMRWHMAVLRESPWYQEILQQGLQQGAQRQLLRLLQLKFEFVPLEVQATLQKLSVEQSEAALAIALAVNSLDEFVQRLALAREQEH